ncbi:MAG: hypothetical protein M1833_000409 [Piccolia ochrophora]|nr:MAG: hypothetical protein M1833_000409 [Piccolia ochrophora]
MCLAPKPRNLDTPSDAPALSVRGLGITEAQLLAIAPTSNPCSGASYPDECHTASQATPFVNDAFAHYDITCPTEVAALLSLIALGSGEFKYQKNHFPAPGRPGQGTRNMQSAAFNVLYALSIPALQAKVAAITGGSPADALPPGAQNEVRGLVLADGYD